MVKKVARHRLSISEGKSKSSAPRLPRMKPTMFTKMTPTAVNSTGRLRFRQMSRAISMVRSVRMSESGIPSSRHTAVTTTCRAANPWIRYEVFHLTITR